MNTSYRKEELLTLINSNEFRNLFLNYNITNIILFGSITTNDFNEESDVDIAIISKEKLAFKDELTLTLQLEAFLKREIDIIDINDPNVNNMVKISALNSKQVIIKDDLLNKAIETYEELYKENEEFWSRLDRVVLDIE